MVPAAIGIAFLGRYGWDRDELYFLAASHRLVAGYVDHPPLIAVGSAFLPASECPIQAGSRGGTESFWGNARARLPGEG
jgi:hypothetical protein